MNKQKRMLGVYNHKLVPFRIQIMDLLEDHPFEIGLSVALVFIGARSITIGVHTSPGSSYILPIWLSLTYCVLSMVGGLSVLTGIFCRYFFSWAYGLERSGLFISASAWAAFIVALLLTPLTSSSILMSFALTALVTGCLLRARSISRASKAVLVALSHAKVDREERDG